MPSSIIECIEHIGGFVSQIIFTMSVFILWANTTLRILHIQLQSAACFGAFIFALNIDLIKKQLEDITKICFATLLRSFAISVRQEALKIRTIATIWTLVIPGSKLNYP